MAAFCAKAGKEAKKGRNNEKGSRVPSGGTLERLWQLGFAHPILFIVCARYVKRAIRRSVQAMHLFPDRLQRVEPSTIDVIICALYSTPSRLWQACH
jgi:hypothetical protein